MNTANTLTTIGRLLLAALILLVVLLCLSSCTSGGAMKLPNGSTVLAPTSLLGEQAIDEYAMTMSPDGAVSITMKGYRTHNPDRDLTQAVKTGYLANQAAQVTKAITKETGLTTRHLSDNATKETLGAQGVQMHAAEQQTTQLIGR